MARGVSRVSTGRELADRQESEARGKGEGRGPQLAAAAAKEGEGGGGMIAVGHDPQPCHFFFRRGGCNKGNACNYSHDPKVKVLV